MPSRPWPRPRRSPSSTRGPHVVAPGRELIAAQDGDHPRRTEDPRQHGSPQERHRDAQRHALQHRAGRERHEQERCAPRRHARRHSHGHAESESRSRPTDRSPTRSRSPSRTPATDLSTWTGGSRRGRRRLLGPELAGRPRRRSHRARQRQLQVDAGRNRDRDVERHAGPHHQRDVVPAPSRGGSDRNEAPERAPETLG